ncbi:MAG: phosphotransferase [Candidatus Hadarchaeum sp.]
MRPLGQLRPLAPLIQGGDLAYRLLRNRAGALWLLPESSKRVRGARLVFAPRNLLLRCVWAAWDFGLPVGSRLTLNSQALQQILYHIDPGLEATGVVVYVGTPGAYRKGVLGVWSDGTLHAVIRLALVPAANEWVAREASVLSFLKDKGADSVPKLLHTGLYDDHAFLVMEPVIGSLGPSRLTRAHFAYSAWLFGLERLRQVWGESSLLREWLVHLSREDLVRAFPILEQSLAWLGNRLSDRPLSFGWAHRDFAPWNTRWVRGKLFLLDWEMAQPYRPPGYDLLHFVSIQAALRKKSVSVPWRALRAWLEVHAPEWVGLEKELYVLYLLDQALFYAQAREEVPDAGEDHVLNWLLNELRSAVIW